MNVLNKIRHRFFLVLEELAVKKQASVAARVYDLIFEQKSGAEISREVNAPLSTEIKNILKKIDEVGYLSVAPLQKEPTVSVVIPHYNQNKFLEEALLNLTKQTVLPEEVIVVDDVSPNQNEVEIICGKHKDTLNLKLIKSDKKLYAGGAKQLGAETAIGDIVVMHDADDVSHVNRVELTKKFFVKYPDALQLNFGFVRFQEKYPDDKYFADVDMEKFLTKPDQIREVMKEKFITQKFSAIKKYVARLGFYGVAGDFGTQAGHVAYRREIASRLKWSSPFSFVFTKFEDYDFNFMLFLLGQKSYVINLPIIYYRAGSSTNVVEY